MKRFISKFSTICARQSKTLEDQMFLVDLNDNVIGRIDKRTAHEMSYLNSIKSYPHRAFSVFLFNSNNDLLMHERSPTKITFPLHWTNSCCSHPILHDSVSGIFTEAIERVNFELGVDIKSCKFNSEIICKVLYKAIADQIWGEYELDYLIFIKVLNEEVKTNLNLDEVTQIKWLKKENATEFVRDKEKKITPWFKRIVEQTEFLEWWKRFTMEEPKNWDPHQIIVLEGD